MRVEIWCKFLFCLYVNFLFIEIIILSRLNDKYIIDILVRILSFLSIVLIIYILGRKLLVFFLLVKLWFDSVVLFIFISEVLVICVVLFILILFVILFSILIVFKRKKFLIRRYWRLIYLLYIKFMYYGRYDFYCYL